MADRQIRRWVRIGPPGDLRRWSSAGGTTPGVGRRFGVSSVIRTALHGIRMRCMRLLPRVEKAKERRDQRGIGSEPAGVCGILFGSEEWKSVRAHGVPARCQARQDGSGRAHAGRPERGNMPLRPRAAPGASGAVWREEVRAPAAGPPAAGAGAACAALRRVQRCERPRMCSMRRLPARKVSRRQALMSCAI